jgi:hypothetical protein
VDTAGNQSSASRHWTIALATSPPVRGADADGSGGNSDDRVALELFGKKAQRARRSVTVGVACLNEPCLASASGVLLAGRRFKLKRAATQIGAGKRATLKLKLSAKARRAAKRMLRGGKKVTVKVTVTAVDAAGNTATARRRIKLKR